MLQNKLKLNDTKIEFLIIGTGRQISKLDVLGIKLKVGNSIARPSDTVRDLGVWFYSSLNMESHVWPIHAHHSLKTEYMV